MHHCQWMRIFAKNKSQIGKNLRAVHGTFVKNTFNLTAPFSRNTYKNIQQIAFYDTNKKRDGCFEGIGSEGIGSRD